MRNLKTIVILTVFLVLLMAANLAVRYGADEVKAADRQTLVENMGDVCALRIKRKGAAAVELVRTDAQWRLRSPYSGSVDEQAVMRVIDILSMTPISDVMSDSALLRFGRTRADFSLSDPSVRVVLSDGAGKEESIGFGCATPIPGGVFASIGDMDSVFIVSSNVLAAVDVDAERFRRRSLFEIGPDAVASFQIKRGAGAPLEFERIDSEWKIRNVAVSTQKVREFISGITSAEALGFVWPVGASNETEHVSTALLVSYGLDPDAAITVSLKCVDGETRRVSFGKLDDQGRAYALVHNGTTIVTVPATLRGLAEQDESVFADSRLFPFEGRSVGSFFVSEGDVRYALVRGTRGEWMLESPVVAKADDTVVNEVLSRIISLSSSDIASAENGVSVSIGTNAEKSVVSRASVFGSRLPEDFRSREILRIDPVHVRRIVRITDKESGLVAVVYDRERKAWKVEDGAADVRVADKGIESVLSAINPLLASRIVKLKVQAADLDDYGLDTPFLTVAIDQDVDDSVRRNIIIGKKTKGGRFATIGSSDAVFVMGEELVERLSAEIVGK